MRHITFINWLSIDSKYLFSYIRSQPFLLKVGGGGKWRKKAMNNGAGQSGQSGGICGQQESASFLT